MKLCCVISSVTLPAEQACGGSSKGAGSDEKLKAAGKCPAWKQGRDGSKDKQFLLPVLLGTTLWKSKFFPLNSVVSQRAYVRKVISVLRLMLFLNLFNFGLSFYPSRQSILYSLT